MSVTTFMDHYAYILCIILLSLLVFFAFWVLYFTLTNRMLLPTLPFRLAYSPLFLPLRPLHTPSLPLPFLFFLRRLIFALTLTLIPSEYHSLQLISLMIQSMVYLGYTLHSRPYAERWMLYLETFNEATLLAVLWASLVFVGYQEVSGRTIRFTGWVCTGFAAFNVLVNVTVIVCEVVAGLA